MSWELPRNDFDEIIKIEYFNIRDRDGNLIKENIPGNETFASLKNLEKVNHINLPLFQLLVIQKHPSEYTNPTIPASTSGAPNNVKVEALEGSVKISWEPPIDDGGSEITEYQIIGNGTISILCPCEKSKVITGLNNGQEYIFKIKAINEKGVSAPVSADPVTPFTLPSKPENIIASAGDKNAIIEWNKPNDNGGREIIEYEVIASPNDVPSEIISKDRFEKHGLATVIEGLKNGVNYQFAVRARNQRGWGPESTLSNIVKPITITPPFIVEGNSLVNINEGSGLEINNWSFRPAQTGDTHQVNIDWGDGINEPGKITQIKLKYIFH